MMLPTLLAGLLAATAPASAAPLRPDDARLTASLQSFVDAGFGSRFRRLGEESDFDHGHLLLDARSGALVAILYHTAELAEPAPARRSWIQWLDGRGVEPAERYERASYPAGAEWDWFVARDLPRLRARRTVVERMLDPGKLGVAVEPGPQWTFTRRDCAGAGPEGISITLPDRTPVCLTPDLL